MSDYPPKCLAFLESIVGKDGAQILIKSSEKAVNGKALFLPQAILTWANKNSYYDNALPGCPDIHLTLYKTEDGLSGKLLSKEFNYDFKSTDISEVVVVIGLSLGVSNYKISNFKGVNVKQLSKSLESLMEIKANTFRIKNTPSSIKVLNSQIHNNCPTCNQPQFQNSNLVGCKCFVDLHKNDTKITNYQSYYLIEFGKDWLEDEIDSFIAKIKKRA